jgi:hypothetical protein
VLEEIIYGGHQLGEVPESNNPIMLARFLMSNLYLLAGACAAVLGVIAVVVSRLRKTPGVDQVSPNVLDRIRTEYR